MHCCSIPNLHAQPFCLFPHFRLNFTKQSPGPTSTAPSAIGVQANVKPTRRNASASVARAVALTKATKRKSRKQTKSAESTPDVSPNKITDTTDQLNASTSDEALDDGMGENIYDGGKLLENDFFKSLLFSFQRIPNNEPWYETFSRQDNHEERVFEYWGNTGKRQFNNNL